MNDGLTAGLLLQLLVGGAVDGVVEQCALGRAGWHAAHAASAHINFRLIHGASQRMGVVGVVGKKIEIHIEGD